MTRLITFVTAFAVIAAAASPAIYAFTSLA